MGRGKPHSLPVHYVKVLSQDTELKTITWAYYKPVYKNFTNGPQRYLTKDKAQRPDAFTFNTKVEENSHTCPFDANEIIVGWDLENNESGKRIPELQYELCIEQIKCIEAAQRQ